MIIPHVLQFLFHPCPVPHSYLQHYTFYDFIVNKARGKSGPLFNFDVHDDVRLLADATVEKDEVCISFTEHTVADRVVSHTLARSWNGAGTKDQSIFSLHRGGR